jgi:hypothetical protein
LHFQFIPSRYLFWPITSTTIRQTQNTITKQKMLYRRPPLCNRSINPLNTELNPICLLLILLGDSTFMGKCIISISNKMQRHTVYMWKLLCMFRLVLPPIIRSAYNCIYSVWYLSHRYCYLPLSWKSWNRFECAVGGVRHPQHTQTGFN